MSPHLAGEAVGGSVGPHLVMISLLRLLNNVVTFNNSQSIYSGESI